MALQLYSTTMDARFEEKKKDERWTSEYHCMYGTSIYFNLMYLDLSAFLSVSLSPALTLLVNDGDLAFVSEWFRFF